MDQQRMCKVEIGGVAAEAVVVDSFGDDVTEPIVIGELRLHGECVPEYINPEYFIPGEKAA